MEIDGQQYQLVCLDFETYYDKDYTLAGTMNTSEYVRDVRFHAHGVGLKVGDAPAVWRTDVAQALSEIDWSRSAMLCHNTAFDGFICSEHYGVVPAFYLDTLSMARAVLPHNQSCSLQAVSTHFGLAGKVKAQALVNTKGVYDLSTEELSRLGAYCIDDVDLCLGVFHNLYPYVSDPELKLIDITLRMFCTPVLEVDLPLVQAELEREQNDKEQALELSEADPADLMSNMRLAEVLMAMGVNPPLKVSKTTGELTYAFAKSDPGFKELLEHEDPRVVNLVAARLKIKSTIGETRAKRFLAAGGGGAPLPVLLNYCGAHTTRWSAGNKMNLQNLPRGGALRRSIRAPHGSVVVVADSSQIEARMLAWLAGQGDLVQAFANNEDVYKLMATAIFNVPIERVTKTQRQIAKVCVLGLGYGMSANRLHDTLGFSGLQVPVTECERMVSIYRTRNYKIPQYWRFMDRVLMNMVAGIDGTLGPLQWGKGFIRLPNGLFLQYPDLHAMSDTYCEDMGAQVTEISYKTRKGRVRIYGAMLTENVTQALARVVIGEQMLEIAKKYRIVTMTHDEVVCVAPEEQAEECLEFMRETMAQPPKWGAGLPLAAEGGHAANYSK